MALPHQWPANRTVLSKGFSNVESFIDAHYKCLIKTFPWMPKHWWADEGCAVALHEGLKSVVGNHAEWMGEASDKPLSLAGVYFLMLVALHNNAPSGANLELLHVKNWKCFHRQQQGSDPGGTSFDEQSLLQFLPWQGQSWAERSVRTLYRIFSALAVKKGTQQFGVLEFRQPSSEVHVLASN